MNKKIISLLIATTMLFSFASISFASENEALALDSAQSPLESSLSTGSKDLEVVFLDADEEIPVVEPEAYDGNDIPMENSELASNKDVPEMEKDETKILTKPNMLRGSVGNPAAGTYVGTIPTAGDAAWLTVDVNPGEAIYATLECPTNPQLDYDLYLYDYDSGEIYDISDTWTYFNTIRGVYKTVDEGCMAINNSSAVRTYVVQVQAAVGYSSVNTFKLTIDVTDACDNDEPNENVFSAKVIPYATITNLNATIDCANDHDWYVFQTPVANDLEFKAFDIQVNNGIVDLYKYVNGKLVYVTDKIEGKPVIDVNTVYAVCITGNGYVGDYTYSHTGAFGVPRLVYFKLDSSLGTGNKLSLRNGYCPAFKGTSVYVQVSVTTRAGYTIKDAITNVTYSPSWDWRVQSVADTGSTNTSDGWTPFAKFSNMNTARGEYSGTINGTNYVYDCGTMAIDVTSPANSPVQSNQNVYHIKDIRVF